MYLVDRIASDRSRYTPPSYRPLGADASFGSDADEIRCPRHVRLHSKSGAKADIPALRIRAIRVISHCRKTGAFSSSDHNESTSQTCRLGDDILTHIAAGNRRAGETDVAWRKEKRHHVRNIHGAIAVSDTAQPRYLTVPPRPGAKRRSALARISGSRGEARGHGART
jgi:hypothetical protein